MRNKISILLVLFVLAFMPESYSQEELAKMTDIDAFKSNMQEAAARTYSITSDFVQHKHLDFLEESVLSRGVFYFEKDDKLRWEYQDPFYYLIVFRGDSIMIRNDSKTSLYNAATNRMFKEINQIMVSMVNGSILESGDFAVSYFEKTGHYVLELIPHDSNMKEFLEKILIYINQDDYSADELFMMERSADYTHIRFTNKKLNEDIPANIFSLP